MGFNIVDVETEEWMIFAAKVAGGGKIAIPDLTRGAGEENETSRPIMSSYEFFPKALEFANNTLARVRLALESYDLVVMDEIGYLEMKGGGFQEGFSLLGSTFDGCRVTIVRETILDRFVEISGGIFQVICVTEQNRGLLGRRLFTRNVLLDHA
jgi:nucleoside-triphosphatase THEP1